MYVIRPAACGRDEWLKERKKGVGGSDVAAVLGFSKWKSNVRLWEEKLGLVKAEDISGNPRVSYGINAEAALRELFALDYGDRYDVEYQEHKIIRNPCYPFIFATLDGELTERVTGRKGVLEIKTAEVSNGKQLAEWNGRIPEGYYCQVIGQLAATGYDFACLKAQIRLGWSEGGYITRHYFIERAEVEGDIELVIAELRAFWRRVESGEAPAVKLPAI